MAQIDPTSEALRTALGQSYLSNLQNTPQIDISRGAAAPAAGDVQSYLDLYKQIDPQGYAQRAGMAQQVADYVTRVTGQAPTSAQDALAKYQQLDPAGFQRLQDLGTGMSSYLQTAQQQAALGAQLDPFTAREVEQQTRAGQAARGNVYGTPQLVAEAMARGTAGEARQQQRLQNLSQALGQQQSYLGSGLTMGAVGNQLYNQGLGQQQNALGLQQNWLSSGQSLGDIANNLYNQGYGRYLQGFQQNQALRQQAQANALGYLGSGQTPYQAGASYLNMAQQNAANAAQGGPQYNPASLGQNYLSNQQQQYGLDIGSQAQNYYNSLANYSGAGGATKNRTGAALGGAASGALSGATAGAALGGPYAPVTAAIGGVLGGALGGAGGYFS